MARTAKKTEGPTLEETLAGIRQDFGEGAIMKMSDNTSMTVESIPTGCLTLDLALGIGGLPRGRVVEIFGPEAGGKSTIALHCVAEAQRKGGVCAYIDVENALDPIYARAIGVTVDELLISQPDNAERALEIAERLTAAGVAMVVIDSVATLVPQAEIEGDMGDSHPGLQARLMSQALRKINRLLNHSKTIVVFINQIREKIGVMYGSPEVTSGGRALKFYSSVRLDVRRIETLKEDNDAFANRVRVKVVKNKVASPFKQAEFDLVYGQGISREGALLDVAIDLGIIKKSGAWLTYTGETVGQGREKAKTFLKETPNTAAEIEKRVREIANGQDPTPSVVDEDRSES